MSIAERNYILDDLADLPRRRLFERPDTPEPQITNEHIYDTNETFKALVESIEREAKEQSENLSERAIRNIDNVWRFVHGNDRELTDFLSDNPRMRAIVLFHRVHEQETSDGKTRHYMATYKDGFKKQAQIRAEAYQDVINAGTLETQSKPLPYIPTEYLFEVSQYDQQTTIPQSFTFKTPSNLGKLPSHEPSNAQAMTSSALTETTEAHAKIVNHKHVMRSPFSRYDQTPKTTKAMLRRDQQTPTKKEQQPGLLRFAAGAFAITATLLSGFIYEIAPDEQAPSEVPAFVQPDAHTYVQPEVESAPNDAEVLAAWTEDHPNVSPDQALEQMAHGDSKTIDIVVAQEEKLANQGRYQKARIWLGRIANATKRNR